MWDSQIHILGIAPYEGMKNILERAAADYPNIALDVAIGDLEEGVSIVQNAPRDYYDCIISRGGTAQRIRQISNIPVVDIQLSVYDVLRAIKLAENYGRRYAIVGFPSITEPAHTLCDLLRYDIDILTIQTREDVIPTLTRLHQDGCRMVVSDMVTHTVARDLGMDAFLISSGAESLRDALDQAISFSTAFRRMRQENRILRGVYTGDTGIIVLDHTGMIRYATHGDPPIDLLGALRSHLREALSGKPISFYYKNHNTLYNITGQALQALDIGCAIFHCRPGQIPLRGNKLGIRGYSRVECEHLFMSSFYSISGAMGELEATVSALALSQKSVMITGEDGTGKEQIARALYLRSVQTGNPFLVFNCKLLTSKTWEYLLNHPSSPFNDSRNTLYFQYLEALPESRITQLYAVIQETGLDKRQRLIFSCDCRDGEPLGEPVRRFTLDLGCMVLRLPTLRSRSDEIPSLASLYLASLNQELGKQISGFEPKAIEQLRSYYWPNNNTQFKRILHELAVRCDSSYIRSAQVAELLATEASLTTPASTGGTIVWEGTLEDITRQIIRQTVAAHGGNQTAAARQLGIGRTTLWRHLNDNIK